MHKLILVATVTAAAVCMAMPATAQRMGSSNRNAPTIVQSIQFPDGAKLVVEYVSITWAKGRTMEGLMSDEGAANRQRFNENAATSPLGSVEASTAFELGGVAVPAGKYSLYFTIDDDAKWHLVLADKADAKKNLEWTLDLQEGGHHRSRLAVDIDAGDDGSSGMLMIAFGDKHASVPFAPKSSAGD
jgi:hypothetical protein